MLWHNVGLAFVIHIGITSHLSPSTVFLALNSGQFCDDYLRSLVPSLFGRPGLQQPLVTLPGYLQFWGWVFVLVTVGIAFFQPEKNFTEEEERGRQQQQQQYAGGKGRAEDLEQVAVSNVRQFITD